MDALAAELRDIVLRHAPRGWTAADLGADVPIGADGLGLDSIAVVELLLDCEKRWGVPFAAELLQQPPLTIGKLLDRLQAAGTARR